MARPTRLLAAAVASLLLSRWAPLEASDPLLGLLIVLPLAVVALLEIGRWAIDHGGSRQAARPAVAEAAALGGLVLLMLGRRTLGFRFDEVPVDSLLVAGLLLLLAYRLARLLLALRPALGRRLPLRTPMVFLWLPLTVYLALLPWQTAQRPPDGDEPYYLLLAHSLAYDLDLDLGNNYDRGDSLRFLDRRLAPQPGDPEGAAGERYSRHNALLPLVLAPAYRLGGRLGALAVMALMTAAVAWLTLRLAARYLPERPGEALLAYTLLAFSAPLLLYSYQVWSEVPAALLTLAALDRMEHLRSGGRLSRRGWMGLLALLLLLPLLKLRFAVLSGTLLLLGTLGNSARRRRLLLIGALLLATALALLLFNQILYGNPLKHRPLRVLWSPFSQPQQALVGGLGLLYDCAFGLFAYTPLWVLVLPAILLLARRRSRILGHFALVFLPYLAFIFVQRAWYGGWSPPLRYGLVALPFMALMLAPLLASRRSGGARFLMVFLGGLTLVLQIVWVMVPGWTYNLADGGNHLLDHLARLFNADVGRLFPSYVRPRLASWLWPAVTTPLVCLLWWRPRRSRGQTPALGAAGLMLALPLTLLLARELPTRLIEFEDSWVGKEGGALFPERWAVARHAYRGGWMLAPGEIISVPLAAGGERLELEVELRLKGETGGRSLLVLSAEGEELDRASLQPTGEWQRVKLGPVRRPEGPLELSVRGPGLNRGSPEILLDRARVSWE